MLALADSRKWVDLQLWFGRGSYNSSMLGNALLRFVKSKPLEVSSVKRIGMEISKK
jgi:hypothetical protein